MEVSRPNPPNPIIEEDIEEEVAGCCCNRLVSRLENPVDCLVCIVETIVECWNRSLGFYLGSVFRSNNWEEN